MLKKIKKLSYRILIHLAIILSVILLCETFIGNYKHFLIMPDNEITYNIDDFNVVGLRYDKDTQTFEATRNNPYIEINDINKEIKTIFLDAEALNPNKVELQVDIHYTDETRPTYVNYSKPLKIIKDYENSKYLQEDFFGKSDKIRFTFKIKNDEKIKINQIGFNHKIPFNFSFTRVIAMLTITLFTYLFIMGYKYKDQIKEKKLINLITYISLTSLSMVLILLIYGEIFNGFANSLTQTTGTQLSKDLVDSFMHGQLSMLELPSDKILALDNPYILANRQGLYYLWDHLLFNGKYYSYYGITPVIILFLPFKLLTGYYMYDGHAVLLFSLISTLFLSFAYFKLIKKRFNNLPIVIQALGYIILFMSCGILSNIVRPAFYEVSTSCAFMCLTIALYHLVSSNLLENELDNKLYHSITFTFWLSLAVLSRATYALYAICAVIIIVLAYIYKRQNYTTKKAILFFVYTLLPFVIFGGIQCIYNYLRFGNIFEFGIKYSLTINDFTNTSFHGSLAWNSIYNFLFAIPTINDQMYFVHPQALSFGASGFYFFETTFAIGLFSRVPILYMIFIMPFMKSEKTIKEKLIHLIKYVLPCIIIPFILVIVTWESGFAIRYYSDFAWAMVLYILFVFFNYYSKAEARNDKSAILCLSIILFITMMLSFIGGMAVINAYVPNMGRHIGYEDLRFTYKYYRKGRELAFWY